MFTVHDFKHAGMPVLATVTNAEAGYEFAERNGFRESARVLPREAPDAPGAHAYSRFDETMKSVRITDPHESFPGEQTIRARYRAFVGGDDTAEESRVAECADSIGRGTGVPFVHVNAVSVQGEV